MLWIPDFPVFADPYIGMEDDYRKGRRAERAADSDFRTLVNYYWSIHAGHTVGDGGAI